MNLSEHTRERITGLIEKNRVMLFMKGNRRAPQCGFSARVIGILDSMLPDYETFDVLSDPEIREGIKTYSSWPTIPQLYVAGEFLGGCDIVTELYESGELYEKLGVPRKEVKAPAIEIGDAAAKALRETGAGAHGKELHLSVDAQFQNQLYLGPQQPGELVVEANGIRVLIPRASAAGSRGSASMWSTRAMDRAFGLRTRTLRLPSGSSVPPSSSASSRPGSACTCWT